MSGTTTTVTLDGDPREDAAIGYTLSEGTATSQQWESSDDGAFWEPIGGATEATFTPGDGQVGALLRVTVELQGGGGVSSGSERVGNVNDPPAGAVTVTGSANQGETLTATNNVTDADGEEPDTRELQWQVGNGAGGWTDIPGATGTTYTLTANEVGFPVRAVLSYTDAWSTNETVASAGTAAVGGPDTNADPEGEVTVTGTAEEDGTLTATNNVTDADGIPSGGGTYKWQVQGEGGAWTDISGATAATFTLTQAEVGRAVRAVLSYTDQQGRDETVASTATAAIENTNDVPAGAVTVTGPVRSGATLTATSTVTDADGIPSGGGTLKWQVEGEAGVWTDIAGATGPTLDLMPAQVGHAVRAVFSYTDEQGTPETVESAATAPIGRSAVLNGVPTEDQPLTYTYDGTERVVSQQWESTTDGGNTWNPITDANQPTFTPGDAQVGTQVRVLLQVEESDGSFTPRPSPRIAVVNVNDAPGGALTVGGTAKQGETLTATSAVTDADGFPSGGGTLKWQVEAEGGAWTDIAGATGATFVPRQAEVGHAVRAVLSYTDAQGTAETVQSTATAAVENTNDAPAGSPTLDDGPGDTPVEGTPVTVNVSGVSDADGLGTFTHVWSREGAGGGAWTVIEGASGASYTPDDADVGGRLRVVTSYTDGGGTTESFASQTTGVVTNVNDAPGGALTVGGTARVGATLTATSTVTDADGFPSSGGAYKWQVQGEGGAWTDINGATAATFAPTQAQMGHAVRAVLSYTDNRGTAERVESAATAAVNSGAVESPAPEAGETPENAAKDEWTSTYLGGLIAEGRSFAPPSGVERFELADGVLSYGTGTVEAFVARLYLGLLGREGDVNGLAAAVEAIENGFSRTDVAGMFLSSAEYQERAGQLTDSAFVADLYDVFLGREGGDDERGFWTSALDQGLSRGDIASGIASSAEAGTNLASSTTGIFVAEAESISARSIYRCALGREADAPGLVGLSNVLEEGLDAGTLGRSLDGAAEFTQRHGGSTDEAFVESLYQNGIGRQADADGLAYWVGVLDSGLLTRGEVAVYFAMAAEPRYGLDWAL